MTKKIVFLPCRLPWRLGTKFHEKIRASLLFRSAVDCLFGWNQTVEMGAKMIWTPNLVEQVVYLPRRIQWLNTHHIHTEHLQSNFSSPTTHRFPAKLSNRIMASSAIEMIWVLLLYRSDNIESCFCPEFEIWEEIYLTQQKLSELESLQWLELRYVGFCCCRQ